MILSIRKFPGFVFAIKCAFAVGFIMFTFMALGEIFVDPEMFGGFLKKPKTWFFIFYESAIWILPSFLLMPPIFNRLKGRTPSSAKAIITIGWLLVGLIAVVGYKLTYFPDNWALDQLFQPQIIFGWILPCLTILGVFIRFSQTYVSGKNHE